MKFPLWTTALVLWFLPGGDSVPQGQYLETFLILITGDGSVFGISLVEFRGTAKHSTMYKAASTAKNYLTHKVSSASVEKLCTNKTHWKLM